MKNRVLKAITAVAGIVFAYSICCFDSYNIKPFVIAALVSFTWLALFCYANYVR